MTIRKQIVLVLAGYTLAFVIAIVGLQLYIASTGGPDRQTYGAMFAFGDDLLFLALFGIASLPATGVALYFLRAYRPFWIALSIAAVVLASTGLAALLAIVAPGTMGAHSAWAGFSPIRALITPIFAIGFFLAGILAPGRAPRITLLSVAAVEAGIFALTVLQWAHSSRLY